ncbi:MAG: MraY family glycosyltransferase [Actinomycetota bacterium]
MSLESLNPALRYGLAFSVPLVGTLALMPVAGRLARRFNVMDRPGGHKTHGEATPYLGGLAVALGLVAIAAVTGGADGKLLTVVACAAVLGFVGLVDDLRTVRPWIRLSYEAVAGLALWLVGIRAGVWDIPLLDAALTVAWVVAVTNAFNFIDNMDGVAGAVAAAAGLGIAVISGSNGDYLVASLALAVAGASLGFLRYNFPPASIFLGDAGSLLLGFLVAALVLQVDLPIGPGLPRVVAVVLMAGVPLFDLTLVVVARLRERRPLAQGGADHSTHRLSHEGRSRREVVFIAAAAQLASSGGAYALYRRSTPVVVAAASVVTTGWILLVLWFLAHPGALAESD